MGRCLFPAARRSKSAAHSSFSSKILFVGRPFLAARRLSSRLLRGTRRSLFAASVRSVGPRLFENLILQFVSWAAHFHPQGWPSGPKRLTIEFPLGVGAVCRKAVPLEPDSHALPRRVVSGKIVRTRPPSLSATKAAAASTSPLISPASSLNGHARPQPDQ
jgi:hypothetical protein